ncbi:MAG: acyltransferase, partial [Neisseria sp.]|nr:acyltransferase [Neisseria sp.]
MLPPSYEKPFGPVAKKVRYFFACRISDNIAKNVNIEKGAYVLADTVVGENSSIGVNSEICKGLTLGKNVFMGPECLFYSYQHKFDPVTKQYDGYTDVRPIVIEDNVWLGRRAIIMGG